MTEPKKPEGPPLVKIQCGWNPRWLRVLRRLLRVPVEAWHVSAEVEQGMKAMAAVAAKAPFHVYRPRELRDPVFWAQQRGMKFTDDQALAIRRAANQLAHAYGTTSEGIQTDISA